MLDGAVQNRCSFALPGVTLRAVGAPGAVPAVASAIPIPTRFGLPSVTDAGSFTESSATVSVSSSESASATVDISPVPEVCPAGTVIDVSAP